jgi:hypothetical protein
MNHKHRAILHALFAHPLSSNIDPKMVKATLEELGAEITHGGHGFHDSHHALPKDEVVALRKFLTEAGIDPERDYPL